MPSRSATRAIEPRGLSVSARTSKTILTARSRSSAGYGFLDTMSPYLPRGHSLQGTRGAPESFLLEVSQSLRQLGLKACPVCGLADSLGIGHLPVLLFDGGYPPRIDDHPPVGDCDGDLTFAVRIECT